MSTISGNILKAIEFIMSKTSVIPKVGIVLGTGIGGLAREIEADTVIPYSEIPGFSLSTVEFHEGRLIIGTLSGKKVIAMQGRFHYYEGLSMQEITFPIRVMKALGAEVLVISNAAGGIKPGFEKGEIVLIDDHINLLGDNPLIGVNDSSLGSRFPDMSEPYSRRLSDIAKGIASENGIKINKGVYAAVAGPSLETRAEYRFLRMIGADMVGMSTVPEDIVAVQMGMEVLGLTIISDLCDPDKLETTSIEEIIKTCEVAEPRLTLLVKEVIKKL